MISPVVDAIQEVRGALPTAAEGDESDAVVVLFGGFTGNALSSDVVRLLHLT
jgi:hypothetical protein